LPHWCAVPELQAANWTSEQIRNISIPGWAWHTDFKNASTWFIPQLSKHVMSYSISLTHYLEAHCQSAEIMVSSNTIKIAEIVPLALCSHGWSIPHILDYGKKRWLISLTFWLLWPQKWTPVLWDKGLGESNVILTITQKKGNFSVNALPTAVQESRLTFKFKLDCDRLSVGQFVLMSGPHWGRWPDFDFLCLTIAFFQLHVGCPLW
jgi:hypothetical protein